MARAAAGLALMASLVLAAGGCGRGRPKVVGWPRETPLGGAGASTEAEAGASAETGVGAETGAGAGAGASAEAGVGAGAGAGGGADTDAGAAAGAEAGANAEADPGAGPDAGAGAAAPHGCRGLIDAACELLGRFSQECAEARAATPGLLSEDLDGQCDEALARFRDRYGDEVPPSACRHLADLVCQGAGAGTEACEEARVRAKVLRKPYLRRACLGDLLLLRARRILPPRPR